MTASIAILAALEALDVDALVEEAIVGVVHIRL